MKINSFRKILSSYLNRTYLNTYVLTDISIQEGKQKEQKNKNKKISFFLHFYPALYKIMSGILYNGGLISIKIIKLQ